MNGKKRCQILKEIRQRIADENEIAFVTSECRHKGDCLGTCPRCEAEVQYLERELAKRQALGKTVAVASLAIAVTAVGGCAELPSAGSDMTEASASVGMDIKGGMPLPPESSELEFNGIMPPETYEELMGDIAYLPPPTITELEGLSSSEILSRLSLCVRRDLLDAWGELLVDAGENSDAFSFGDSQTILVLTYYRDGFVSSTEIRSTKTSTSDERLLPGDTGTHVSTSEP